VYAYFALSVCRTYALLIAWCVKWKQLGRVVEVEQGLQDVRDSVRGRSDTVVTATIVTSLKKLAPSLFLRVPEGCAPC